MSLTALPTLQRWSDRKYIRIPRREIAFFKFMLEAEHNLAVMTVVDKFEAIIALRFAPEQHSEVEGFLNRMEHEMPLERLWVPDRFEKQDNEGLCSM
jgi:hypothetical protein